MDTVVVVNVGAIQTAGKWFLLLLLLLRLLLLPPALRGFDMTLVATQAKGRSVRAAWFRSTRVPGAVHMFVRCCMNLRPPSSSPC